MTTTDQADSLFRLCFLFCALGHLIDEGYVERKVVFEWVAPFAVLFFVVSGFRTCTDFNITGLLSEAEG